jgi:hypothetical protein
MGKTALILQNCFRMSALFFIFAEITTIPLVNNNESKMRKRIVGALIALFVFSIGNVMGQSYDMLWKKEMEAERNDLPQTQRTVLGQIIRKAEREAQYGQLLKALLKDARAACEVSPDSLKPFVQRLVGREQQSDNLALQAVFQAVLGHIYANNPEFDEHADELARQYREKAMSHPKELAAVKASDYEPLLLKGKDSRYYNDDLLSVIGYETKMFREMHQYYLTTDNRVAQLFSGIEWLKAETSSLEPDAAILARIDSLIDRYADLTECGEAAIERYEQMERMEKVTAREMVAFLDEALQRWGGWKRMNVLRNRRDLLVMSMYRVNIDHQLTIPHREQTVRLGNLRHLQSLTMNVYRVNIDGDTKLSPNNESDYKKLQPLLTALPELTQTKTFTGKEEYEMFTDSMVLKGLPVGVYMLEFKSQPQTDVSRSLYFVSDLRLLSQALPDSKMRYVVVNATTGQPVKGASVQLTVYKNGQYGQKQTVILTTGKAGECLYDMGRDRPIEVFVTTAADRAYPSMSQRGYFNYNDNHHGMDQVAVYTDRAIYRPGQKVQMAAILFREYNGFEQEVQAGREVTVRLYDANYKEVAKHDLVTDEYGTVSTDFVLPSKGLTGQYSVSINGHACFFRVEEYKRPTFQVEFPKVEQEYQDGDTLTVQATATTYAGVPVQGARVSYRVERRTAWWWLSYSRYWQQGTVGTAADAEEVMNAETMTDEDGHFDVRMPMVLPKGGHAQFYNFVVIADVTDAAGETHQGQLSLPLGNRKTVLTVDLADKMLIEELQPMRLHVLNAAGNDVAATVRYQFDGGKWAEVQSNTDIALPKLKSGAHKLLAVCGEDSLERSFVVFSLDDKRPATETDNWFYVSAHQFANLSDPVTLQVGSSAKDVHIVYTIVAGNKIIEQGSVERSNELVNRKFVYKEEYGNGLSLSYAWVKDGKTYLHSATIRRPVPDNQLSMKWESFRDRLTPGQQEEWTLSIASPTDGRQVEASLMATLYDKSLDQLAAHQWSLDPVVWLPLASLRWIGGESSNIYCYGNRYPKTENVNPLDFRIFDGSCFPYYKRWRYIPQRVVYTKSMNVLNEVEAMAGVNDEALQGRIAGLKMAKLEEQDAREAMAIGSVGEAAEAEAAVAESTSEAFLPEGRKNLQETAFFFPQLRTDSEGRVTMKFTLPESLTTWRFMGLAHTKDLMHGLLEGEAVAKKDVMIQPNVPRFLRMGDEATISARIFNSSEQTVQATARLVLLNAESEDVVCDELMPCLLEANSTAAVQFKVESGKLQNQTMLICKMVVTGESFSDGEQHYLPVLPNQERVTVTVPFVQTEPGTKTIDLAELLPPSSHLSPLTSHLSIEYTNNPAWLVIQALPTLAHPYDDCVICQSTAFYANSIGRHILKQNPKAKNIFELWKQEDASLSTLHSSLEKDEELKDLVLSETPWVMDADREADQKRRLADYFDETLMDNRLSAALERLQKLQNADGSWSWWPGMEGSYYMTVEVSEKLERLQQMTRPQAEVKSMLNKAFGFMDNEIVKLVDEMKKEEKKGRKQTFPSHKALQYLYIAALDGRKPSVRVDEAQTYLKKLLKNESRNLTIYDKAMASIVLNSSLFLKSLHEWTTYKEGVGRYYDTPRAGYSWRDYRIPTQVAVIEAFKRLAPNDQKTIREMQQWLLHEKRAQAWDTPINSADAVYAFMEGRQEVLDAQPKTVLKIDGEELATSAATAGIGYVKTSIDLPSERSQAGSFTAEKTSTGISWGTVYAQYMQDIKDIADHGSEISVKREIMIKREGRLLPLASPLKVGDRITVRITVEAQRDLDFVEVIDKRAACMEPVGQLSGYRNGAYTAPKDNAMHYFFGMLPKGKRIIETEYYIDRAGQYETGTCVAQCAYAPEFRATTHSQTIVVKEQ